MPEMIEVERYRELADLTVGRTIDAVHAPDAWYLKKGTTAEQLEAALVGRTVTGTRRIGKLLLLETDGPTLGLRFGMTGRLAVDGRTAIEKLEYEYASTKDDPRWNRFGLAFEGGGELHIVDSRRLGGVELEPDESHLGVDALGVRPAQLRDLLAGRKAPLKAWLLDQGRLAGVGNLIADEALWRAALDPARTAGSLDDREVRRLHKHLQATIRELTARGGSHTGDLHVARVPGATCPRDGTPLERRTIGGRTTYSCPKHQR
jgi:formamidopyrimidine-DNA glycosylase